MLEILQYPFMQRALIVGVLLAAVLAILGVYVILRRMAFFSDGIAHASLAGVALGIIFSFNPLALALVLSIIFALLIYFLERYYDLASDTIIGIIFTSGMALGVLLISLQQGYQPELISFLFGNILSVSGQELYIIIIVGLAVLAFVFSFFRGLTLLSLDRETAYVDGVKTDILQPALYVALSIAVVLGIKVLGVILVSALLIIPVAIAKIFSRSFKCFIIESIVFSEIIVVAGIIISYFFDLPTGPAIILTGTVIFIISLVGSRLIRTRS